MDAGGSSGYQERHPVAPDLGGHSSGEGWSRMRRVVTYGLSVESATESLSRARRLIGHAAGWVSARAAGAARRAAGGTGHPVLDLRDGSGRPGCPSLPSAPDCRAAPLPGFGTQGADTAALSVSVGSVERIVGEIVGVGFQLAACVKAVDGPVAQRLADAIDDLDTVVPHLRVAAFEHAAGTPVGSSIPPAGASGESVGPWWPL